MPAEAYRPVVTPSNFTIVIDNPYLPLESHKRFYYDDQTEPNKEHVQTTVTEETKTVMGVTCRVVESAIYHDGSIHEVTHDCFAQDSEGSVWLFGHDAEQYNRGSVVSADGGWKAGVDGALPGIVMRSDPRNRESYVRYHRGTFREGWAAVVTLDESASFPWGSFHGVIKIREWSVPAKKGEYHYAYYAPRLGLVMTRSADGEIALQISGPPQKDWSP